MPNPTTIPNEPPTPAKGQPQTLAYSVPQRPAFVTALAVRCVCVAVVYAALSLVIAFGAFLILVSVGPPPIVTHPAAVLVVPRHARNEMLTTEERWVAFKALNAMLLLDPLISAHTPPASAELFTFLLFHGRAVLGGDDDVDPPLTAEAVRAAVKEYRTAAQSTDGAAHFRTQFGNVDIATDHVLFTSADGFRSIRTSMQGGAQFEEPPLSASTRGADGRQQTTALPPDQVQRVLDQLKAQRGRSLNAAELATVRRRLFAPNQKLVRLDSPAPVIGVTTFSNEVTIQFESGWLCILRNGMMTQEIGGQVMEYPSFFSVVGRPAGILMLEALGSAALALCLLAGGIAALRSSRKSRLLLQLYLWLQIPLALAALATVAWLWHAFKCTASVVNPTGWTRLASIAMIVAVVFTLGGAFALWLKVALGSRTVRDYHGSISAR